MRRLLFRAFWRVVNPPKRPLAGLVPWWVLLETTGNRTGRRRTTPFDREVARQFNLYARMGPPLAGIDPVIVRISFNQGGGTT